MPAIFQDRYEITANIRLNHDTHILRFALPPEVAAQCRPGQFFNLQPTDSSAPLLRRPISICDLHPDSHELDLLVKAVGEGTEILCARQPGARVDMVGPLGQGFSADPGAPALMIAGGVGVAPLYWLTRHIAEQAAAEGRPAPDTVFCYGARSEADFVLLDRIETHARALRLTTEDGSRGQAGFVTAAIEDLLAPERRIYVCGPSPMMNAVLRLLRARGLEGQFSLENQMGCGVGACQGCVVPSRQGHLRVCCEGPVVNSNLLDEILDD